MNSTICLTLFLYMIYHFGGWLCLIIGIVLCLWAFLDGHYRGYHNGLKEAKDISDEIMDGGNK